MHSVLHPERSQAVSADFHIYKHGFIRETAFYSCAPFQLKQTIKMEIIRVFLENYCDFGQLQ